LNRVSLCFTSPREVSIHEEGLPEIGPHEVLIRTYLSAISPGTETLIYRGDFPENFSIDANLGQVIESGRSVDSHWKDRWVLAFQPHQSHFIADPKDLITLPNDVKKEDAVFLPNMETAVNFLMDGGPLIGENVAVFGQGIVGLLTTGLLAHFPLNKLITLDLYHLRRLASIELGSHACLDPEGEDLADRLGKCLPDGADLTYELSGAPLALNQAIRATGFAGRVVIGSWYGKHHVGLDLGGCFHRSRIRLMCSQVSSLSPELSGRWTKARRFEVAWDMIRKIRPSRFITHRCPIQQAEKAYQLLDRKPEETIQILFTYHEPR
jgi:threonine dehydrogenase-like Zn-dependent dehydrogenase